MTESPPASLRGPWTVVHLTADDSPATATVTAVLRWLAGQPEVVLHTVLWLPGWTSTEPFRLGRFHDVSRDHEWRVPHALRAAGRPRAAGRLIGVAARRRMNGVPRSGVLYLNGAGSGAALPYLPDGARTVVTHLYAADRTAEPPLPPDKVARLVAATDLWLAEDEATRDWAVEAWGLPVEAFAHAGPITDLADWETRNRRGEVRLDLALLGGTWFRRDHTARVVGALLPRTEGAELALLWPEVEREEHIAPMLHDLDVLGVRDRLVIPSDHGEVHQRLRDADVLVLTAPEDDAPWLAWTAAEQGLPVVCFATHPRAAAVGHEVDGRVVPYLDIRAMADAVVEVGLHPKLERARTFEERRAEVAATDVDLVGRRIARRVEEVRS